MVQHLLAPVDGSEQSWRAFDVAVSLARRCDATVDVVEVVFAPRDRYDAEQRLNTRLAERDTTGVEVTPRVELGEESVAAVLEAQLEQHPEVTIVMASHGRGRSAAVLGSVTEDVLHRTFGPLLVVGPHATESDFSGPVVATIDGSEKSELALPVAVSWAIELGVEPWILEVAEPEVAPTDDFAETAQAARLARRMSTESGHSVQYDVLHGREVAEAVTDYARDLRASVIVATTHGRTGLARFTIGSTAAGFVRHAGCPVLLLRPPHLPEADDGSHG